MVFFYHHTLKTTSDSGAEINLVKQSVANQISASILPTLEIAFQADRVTPMDVVGETHLEFSRDNKALSLQALVVKDLDVDILGGIPFMSSDDISIRPAKQQIIFNDDTICLYGRDISLVLLVPSILLLLESLKLILSTPYGLMNVLNYLYQVLYVAV